MNLKARINMAKVGFVTFFVIVSIGFAPATFATKRIVEAVDRNLSFLNMPMFSNIHMQISSNLSQRQSHPFVSPLTYQNGVSTSDSPQIIGGGGGGGTVSDVTLYVWNGEGQIDIGGYGYSNGAVVSLTEGISYSVSAQPASGYSFYQWMVSGGTVSDGTSSSTSFTPTQGNVVLVLVLHFNPEDYNWGGYEISGSSITSASAQLVVPSAKYVQGVEGANTGEEFVVFWVGIGGDLGNANLWQAGIAIQMNNSNSAWYYAWYEYVGTSTIGITPVLNVHPGDSVSISISYSSGTSYYNIQDLTSGASTGTQGKSFTPNTNTAEWIGESPGGFYFVVPNFGSITFSSIITNAYNGFYAPDLQEVTKNTWTCFLCSSTTQSLVPGYAGSNYFTLSYN